MELALASARQARVARRSNTKIPYRPKSRGESGARRPLTSDGLSTVGDVEVTATSEAATVTVWVETRHLDTDERKRWEFKVEPRPTEALERAQLIEIAARVMPEATIRSFANGAATFLDGQHLVIASYAEPLKVRRARFASNEPDDQDSLFAA